MRVVVPWVELYPGVVEAIRANGIEPELCDVRGSAEAYYEVLARVWSEGRGFTVVEQDVIVGPGNVAEMEACPEPWCAFIYSNSGGYITGLGFTKFSDQLVAERPGVIEGLLTLPPNGTPPKYWGRLDTQLAQQLMDREGQRVHRHVPPVVHLNPLQQLPRWNCVDCGAEVTEAQMRAGPDPYPCLRCGRGE